MMYRDELMKSWRALVHCTILRRDSPNIKSLSERVKLQGTSDCSHQHVGRSTVFWPALFLNEPATDE